MNIFTDEYETFFAIGFDVVHVCVHGQGIVRAHAIWWSVFSHKSIDAHRISLKRIVSKKIIFVMNLRFSDGSPFADVFNVFQKKKTSSGPPLLF
eukprot:m.820723 g.820723  ORF g.820723 m.820723 type:complete len:94 (-) comp23397_c2_seq1:1003-1284(-)